MSRLNTRKLVLALCLLIPFIVQARGINIEQANSVLQGNSYYLEAEIDFEFDDEVIEALEHGVALNIDIMIEIRRKRKWLRDPLVKELLLTYKLERHLLSNNYLITELTSGRRSQVFSLEDAISLIGEIKNYPLISQDVLKPEEIYSCSIKAELDIETLPPLIRPIAYVFNMGSLNSSWYQWVLQSP